MNAQETLDKLLELDKEMVERWNSDAALHGSGIEARIELVERRLDLIGAALIQHLIDTATGEGK